MNWKGKIGNNKSTVKSLEDQNEENKQNERIWEQEKFIKQDTKSGHNIDRKIW